MMSMSFLIFYQDWNPSLEMLLESFGYRPEAVGRIEWMIAGCAPMASATARLALTDSEKKD